MAGSQKNILEYLKGYKESKEESDIELIKVESRLEERIKEVKTDLKSDITQLKSDLEKDIREAKTDLKDDIKEIRNTMRTMTNLVIACGIGILGVIVTLILNIVSK